MVDVAEGSIGPEAKYKMEIVEGKVKISVDYDGKQADAGMYVSIEIKQFVDMLKEAIPGKIDDLILDGLFKALT